LPRFLEAVRKDAALNPFLSNDALCTLHAAGKIRFDAEQARKWIDLADSTASTFGHG